MKKQNNNTSTATYFKKASFTASRNSELRISFDELPWQRRRVSSNGVRSGKVMRGTQKIDTALTRLAEVLREKINTVHISEKS